MKNRFRYPLAIQIVLPERYREDRSFREDLELISGLGLWGVELNIRDPADVDRREVEDVLGEHGLRFSLYASGFTAREFGLSLSSFDGKVRREAMDMCLRMVEFLEGTEGNGIILGFMKGGPSDDPARAQRLFRESLGEIAPTAGRAGVPLIIEATNHTETSVAVKLEDAAAIAKDFLDYGVKILPDTYHLAIEERDMLQSLQNHRDSFDALHLSDDNRYLPGLGSLDFRKVAAQLDRMGYRGRLGLEGKYRVSMRDDLRESVEYLAPIFGEEREAE